MTERLLPSGLRRPMTTAAASCVALLAAYPAVAQENPAPDDLVQMAARQLELLHAGRVAVAWESASPVFKDQVAQDAFLASLGEMREVFGALRPPEWMSVSRASYGDTDEVRLPPGTYADIGFVAGVGEGRRLQEWVSLRLEGDRRWRLVGYRFRMLPAGADSSAIRT